VNSTQLSPDVFGNQAAIVTNQMATDEMRDADALAALVTLLERSRPAWHDAAKCKKHPELDFTSSAPGTISKAIQVCGRCAVRGDCLSWALDIDDRSAVLGGMDPADHAHPDTFAASSRVNVPSVSARAIGHNRDDR
jgi:hypothetical protein